MHFFESLPADPSFTRNVLVDFKIGCFIKKTVVNPIVVPFPQYRGNFINPGIAGSISINFISRSRRGAVPSDLSALRRLCWKQALLRFEIRGGTFLRGYGRSVRAAGLPAWLPRVPRELGEWLQVNGAP